MKRVVILFVCCIFLGACSQSTEYTLYASLKEIPDMQNLKKCLKDAGIPFKIKEEGVFIPKDKADKATNYCD
jgi:hypothetical protein